MLSSAIVTPSFRGDLACCELLSDSLERWVPPQVPHYIVVDRRDRPLFRHLERRPRTRLLVVEDVAPRWLFRIPGVPKVWASLLTLPVRNWILQQIVKVSVAAHVREDVMFFVDSDTFFCRPYDPATEQRDGRLPLFMETGQRGLIPSNDRWHQSAARMLGLPALDSYDTNFIGNNICWRRDHALALQAHLAEVGGKSFARVLAGQLSFSEYILYGLFVTEVLRDSHRHWFDQRQSTHTYWSTTTMDRDALLAFRQGLTDAHHSVMISTKSRTPVPLIREIFLERG